MEVKVRYLAQGIMTISEKDLPPNFATMGKEEAWEWLQDWWDESAITQEDICRGIEDCDSGPSEVEPGLLEMLPDDGDYKTIAMTKEYGGWFYVEGGLELMD